MIWAVLVLAGTLPASVLVGARWIAKALVVPPILVPTVQEKPVAVPGNGQLYDQGPPETVTVDDNVDWWGRIIARRKHQIEEPRPVVAAVPTTAHLGGPWAPRVFGGR